MGVRDKTRTIRFRVGAARGFVYRYTNLGCRYRHILLLRLFFPGVRPSALRQKRSIASKVVFDRPFVFFVFNKMTGLIMLAGKITNPTQVPS